jgi:hypothetical protein
LLYQAIYQEESTMDINTTYPKLSSSASQLASANSKSSAADKLAEQNKIQTADRDGDKDNSVARDSVQLSSESLRLASTSSVQGANNQTQIPDRQQARQALDQLVTGIKNQPNQARLAFGSPSPAKANLLLA